MYNEPNYQDLRALLSKIEYDIRTETDPNKLKELYEIKKRVKKNIAQIIWDIKEMENNKKGKAV